MVDYEYFDFRDPNATMIALAKWFKIQTSDAKTFVKNLAPRHLPATNTAAALCKMWSPCNSMTLSASSEKNTSSTCHFQNGLYIL
jgi:hypothetical protein